VPDSKKLGQHGLRSSVFFLHLHWAGYPQPVSRGAVRYAGTILQLMGLATIAYGLREMRRLFKRPSLFAWFRRFGAAFKAPEPIVVQPSAAEVATTMGQVRVVSSARLGVPLEERVKVIEENLNQLRDDLDTKTQEIRRELSIVKDDVQRESPGASSVGAKDGSPNRRSSNWWTPP
jgi:hypothetical protein